MLGTTKCPFCAEIIQKKAVICKHCHRELPQNESTDAQPETKRQSPGFFRRVLKRWYIHLFLWPISLPIEYLAFINQPDQVEKRRKAAQEEKAHLESLPEKDKVSYLQEKDRKWKLKMFWVAVGLVYVFLFGLMGENPWLSWLVFLVIFVAIWIYPTSADKHFFVNHLKDARAHKGRIGASAAALLVSLTMFLSLSADNNGIHSPKEDSTQLNELVMDEEAELTDAEKVIENVESIQKQLGETNGAIDETENSLATAAPYEIVATEDQSRKAMEKSLLDYTTAEIQALPTNKKILYRVVVTPQIKEAQVKPTVDKIIRELTQADKEIDEIILFLYSDKALAESEGIYDVATATWAPFGDLGNVTSEIAESNLRGTYKTTIKAKEDLESYLAGRNVSEDKFGLTEEQRKQIFTEIVQAEDRANKEARVQYPDPDPLARDYSNESFLAQFNKQQDYADELKQAYKAEVFAKYGIDKDIASKITTEALMENWPLPEY